MIINIFINIPITQKLNCSYNKNNNPDDYLLIFFIYYQF